jgi:hypothetical protein
MSRRQHRVLEALPRVLSDPREGILVTDVRRFVPNKQEGHTSAK